MRSSLAPAQRLLPLGVLRVLLLARRPAAVVALLGICGCFVDRSGGDECADVEASVRPRIVCPGEEVTITWNIDAPLEIPCLDYYDLGFGEGGCIGTVTESIEAILTSSPESVFDGGPLFVQAGPSGSTTITPLADTDIQVLLRRRQREDQSIGCNMGTTSVQVLEPDPAEIAVERLTFTFDCAVRGWRPRSIERGEIASASIRIDRVENLTAFPVIVNVVRLFSDRPPILDEVQLSGAGEGGASTSAIEGEFFGEWGVEPLFPEALGPDGCDSDDPTGDVVLPPGGGSSGVVLRPDIEIVVILVCAPGG